MGELTTNTPAPDLRAMGEAVRAALPHGTVRGLEVERGAELVLRVRSDGLLDVMALLPDHPPRFYLWNGRRHDVVQADGPESVFGEWWVSDAEVFSSRDYYRVQDSQGGRAWLVRATGAKGMRWYIQGLFA